MAGGNKGLAKSLIWEGGADVYTARVLDKVIPEQKTAVGLCSLEKNSFRMNSPSPNPDCTKAGARQEGHAKTLGKGSPYSPGWPS